MEKSRPENTFTVIGVSRSGVQTRVLRNVSRRVADDARRILMKSRACTAVIIRQDPGMVETTEESGWHDPAPNDR